MRRARLAAVVVLSVAAAAQADPSVRVSDLAYGEALFHFFQKDYFRAGVRVMVAKEKGELRENRADADLLLGGLQLSYGMHRSATDTLNRVLAARVSPRTRNRAWYFLARLAYRRGYWDEARATLAKVTADQSPVSAAETALLGGLVALATDRPAEAAEILSHAHAASALTPYLDYNLGVARLRSGQRDEALAVLNRLGTADPSSAEQRAVSDRANLAAGFAELQAGRADRAQRYLQRVRLQGSDARLALLGAGWAASDNADYPLALQMWGELVERSPRDAAVLEALFAVPFAHVQMDDAARAARHYEKAIAVYLEERGKLTATIQMVRDGAFLEQSVNGRQGGHAVPVAPSLQRLELPELIASHPFREGWKSYRDLLQLRRNLRQWERSLGAFDTMLDARKARFDRVLPVIERRLAQLDANAVRKREQRMDADLERTRREGDVWRVATPQQRAQLQTIHSVAERIRRINDAGKRRAFEERIQRIQGVLYWQVHAAFPERLWETTKRSRELDEQLSMLEKRLATLRNARAFAASRLGDLGGRVRSNRRRVQALLPRVDRALDKQKRYLTRLALDTLNDRRAYLESYLLQARYALAQLYDSAQNEGQRP